MEMLYLTFTKCSYISYVYPTYIHTRVCIERESRDTAAGIAIDYGLDDLGIGVRNLVWPRIFLSLRHPHRI
jgi:hypothetical protein